VNAGGRGGLLGQSGAGDECEGEKERKLAGHNMRVS
jgi:hypothetical protein